ncbi:MAG: glycosyltransferase family 39 protein [bacterium]
MKTADHGMLNDYPRATALLLFLIALTLRFYHLPDNPAGFFRDEADKGYTSFCLLTNGQDQTGRSWPLFVRSLNVATSGFYQYADLPFVAALGLTELAVRLPACLAGAGSALAAYALAARLWNPAAGAWAGLFVALTPWSLLLSRWANQSIFLTLWIPLGLFFFLRQKDRPVSGPGHAALSALFFLLALYTYAPAQLYVPVLVVLLWLVSLGRETLAPVHRGKFIRSWFVFIAVFLLGALPLLYHILYQPVESGARFSAISIFDGRPLASVAFEWLKNYFLHFSPGFLFFHGDNNLRHNTAVFGQLHWYLLPLLVAGFLRIITRRSRVDRILLVWLLCFPIAAACTRESIPHALRSIFAVPVFQVIAAYGLVSLGEWKDRMEQWTSRDLVKACRYLWFAAVILCPSVYLYDLYVRYPVYSAVDWEYGYRDAVGWWREHHHEAGKAVVSGLAEYPYIFFLFYDAYPPEKWIQEQKIEGVEFVPTGAPIHPYLQKTEHRVFYLLRAQELPAVQPEKVIYTPAGEIIWKWAAWGRKGG